MTAATHPLAEAFIDDFMANADWQRVAADWGWVIRRPGPLTLLVALRGLELPGVQNAFTLRLECEFCPSLPPNVRFVNPDTGEYDPNVDARHLARLTAPDCTTHEKYGFAPPYIYGPQLVCTSAGHGYYVSSHTPNEDQRWDPTKHSVGTTIQAVQRALVNPLYYQGRFGGV